MPVDAHPGVAKVGTFPVDAHPGVARIVSPPITVMPPRAVARAPAATDPCTAAPQPPPGDLRVIPIRLAQQVAQVVLLADQPIMPGIKIGLVHRPIGMGGHFIRGHGQRPPEVGYHAIHVVHHLDIRRVRPGKQDGQRSGEWLDVILDGAKRRPDTVSHFRLATEIGKWRFDRGCVVHDASGVSGSSPAASR